MRRVSNNYHFLYIESRKEFDSLESSHLSTWDGSGWYRFDIHKRFDTCQYEKMSQKDLEDWSKEIRKDADDLVNNI